MDWAKGTEPLEPNGCAWYRCWLPALELEKFGWDVALAIPEYQPEHGFGAFLGNGETMYGWDIIVFKLIMLKSISQILHGDARPNQKIVVDIDDFYEGLSENNFAYKATDPSRSEEVNRDHYWAIIDAADYLITSTQFLYDFYTKEKGYTNVFLVRNAIDIDRWSIRKDHSRWLPTIGWVGAIPWRSNDLETMQPFLGEFINKNHLAFHHSGHIKEIKNSNAPQLLGIDAEVKFTNQPRMILSKYPELFRKFDIGIVPLNNIPFNHAKSGIKGLEYSAAGIPFVSSASPEYEMLEDQGIGRVARSPEEWEHHLTELLNPKIRKEDVERNFENIKQLHTMEIRGEEWDKVFTQILES
jgi:hypothetical protein